MQAVSAVSALPRGSGMDPNIHRSLSLEAQNEITRLQRRVEELQNEVRQAKEHNVAVQLQAEREEEAITLKLMRRLEQLKREKAALVTEVEQEEEFLTNTLQKRLEKVSLEKAQLELKLLELKKQTEQLEVEKARLAKEKIELEATLDSESEYIVNKLQVQLEKLGSEKKGLLREKADLQRQVSELGQSVDRLNRDKVKLEQEMEMEEESIVNRLQRQLEMVLGSIRLIESKLEAKGLTMRDLGITPFEFAAPETLRIYSRSPSSASSVDKWMLSPHPATLGAPSSSGTLGSSPSGGPPGHHSGSLASHSTPVGHAGSGGRQMHRIFRMSGGGNSGSSSSGQAGPAPAAVQAAAAGRHDALFSKPSGGSEAVSMAAKT